MKYDLHEQLLLLFLLCNNNNLTPNKLWKYYVSRLIISHSSLDNSNEDQHAKRLVT